MQNFHKCNLRAAPQLSTSQAVLGWKFTLFGALGMGEVRFRVCLDVLPKKNLFSFVSHGMGEVRWRV